jgi:hypothetical protein
MAIVVVVGRLLLFYALFGLMDARQKDMSETSTDATSVVELV